MGWRRAGGSGLTREQRLLPTENCERGRVGHKGVTRSDDDRIRVNASFGRAGTVADVW